MTYQGYLIDLDGTMYRESERIDGAAEFVERLHDKGIPYLFITNNSSKTPQQISGKLTEMDIPSTPEQIFTSSIATAMYIKRIKEGTRVLCIGEEGLIAALEQEGFTITCESPDVVVVGIDRKINYEKMAKACLAIRAGAFFVSTNSDTAIPTERGLLPGNGALTSVMTASTGKKPVFVGKPETIIVDEAVKILGLPKTDTLLVGDNYDTDMLAGIRSGIDTLMVFTGVTQLEDLPDLPEKPTHCVHHLKEWFGNI